MLATRIRQKEAEFYFLAYKADDLLERVRFASRYYFEGDVIEREPPQDDEIAQFIAGVERSEKAFQRQLNRRKIRQIVNFYETAGAQPVIPGPILLFTEEVLRFSPIGGWSTLGNLTEPDEEYLVIDGQHRLAGLYFFGERHPDLIKDVEVPCILFDGRSADFATEMFVIINSTHTRISKSHLIDLYERITWQSDEGKRVAARIVAHLYEESDSPLRYRINRLGGRSRKDKWILQSELFNEVHKVVTAHERVLRDRFHMRADRIYPLFRDYLRACRDAVGDVWGDNARYMFTRDVTLKALVRVLGDLVKDRALMDRWENDPSPKAFAGMLAGWDDLAREFRAEGFYERFPAKGQLERVGRIHARLSRGLSA